MDAGERFRLQRRVGFVVMGAAAFLALANAIALFAALHRRPVAVFENPFVYLLFLMGLCSIPTILFDREYLRLCQAGLFLVMGILVIFTNEPVNFGGIAFFVYGLLLALRYGYFERRAYLKFSLAGVLLLTVSAAALRNDPAFETTAIETTAAAGCFLYLLWITFTDEIERYRRESERLRREAIRNQIFVSFGKHTAGIVHNVKSKLMSIEGFNDLIASGAAEDDLLALQRLGIEQLDEMVDGLLLAVRFYQRTTAEVFSLGKTVRSAVEVARADRQIHSGIVIELDLCERDEVFAVPLSVIQILDALIQNACDAAAGSDDRAIALATRREEPFVLCTVRDHGSGLPFCARCRSADCLACRKFRIGRSPKLGGAGIGVAHVQTLVRECGGKLKYRSPKGGGTSVSVWFPRPRQAEALQIDTPSRLP